MFCLNPLCLALFCSLTVMLRWRSLNLWQSQLCPRLTGWNHVKPRGTRLTAQRRATALEAHAKIFFSHTGRIFIWDTLNKDYSSTTLHRRKSNKEPSIFMLPHCYRSNQSGSPSLPAHVKTPWLRAYFTHYSKKLTLLIRDQIHKLVQFNFQVDFIYTRSC